jgi:hypothetical protein
MRAAKWGEYYPEEHFWPITTAIEAGTVNKVKATKTSATKPGFLSKQTVEELAIWRSESRFNKDSDWIFTADGKNPVSHAAVGLAFKRALKYLGLESKGWTPYWIRHTFITKASEVLSQEELCKVAGNSELVSKGYQHPTDELIKKQSAAIKEKLTSLRN